MLGGVSAQQRSLAGSRVSNIPSKGNSCSNLQMTKILAPTGLTYLVRMGLSNSTDIGF